LKESEEAEEAEVNGKISGPVDEKPAEANNNDDELSPIHESKLINYEEKIVHPHDIRDALIKEKRKKFAKKWFTKFNMYKRNHENLEISKRGRASSGIGEERIRQMETAYTIATKARGSRRGGQRK
jgi:hypothetical protein